ncbi:pknH-like domain protein [Mycolicibacterium canariasense]|nr:pknH-like domain protein [Mycolicibacterium canariasense]
MATASCVVAAGLIANLTGCTRVIDTAVPHSAPRVGPILASQVGDLLSKHAQDKDGNRFVTVEPHSCAGVAREQDAPFIVDHHPAATDGGHWVTTDGHEVYVEEIVAVYASDFDPRAAVDGARATLASCRDTPFTVTDMKGRAYRFTMGPASTDARSPAIVVWSFHGADWACDNAFVAAHNAAVELTTCGPVNGYDVGALAKDALKRIEALANSKA